MGIGWSSVPFQTKDQDLVVAMLMSYLLVGSSWERRGEEAKRQSKSEGGRGGRGEKEKRRERRIWKKGMWKMEIRRS